MRKLKFICVIILLVFILLFIFGRFFTDKFNKNLDLEFNPNSSSVVREDNVKVTRVVDGDTIKVLIDNKEDTVRLIGIDSPEVLDERKPVQCFGKEASSKAKEVLIGKTIILESDSTQGDRDEYQRLLRYVFLKDGTNFDKLMIDQGFAREYTFKGRAYRYQSEFIQAEKEAKEENKGLWGSCEIRN